MKRPRAIRPGDRVAIVAPASPFKRDEFDAGISELRRLGFEPVYDERVFARTGYVAGKPELRARALHDALGDPSIAGVLCARGGYGSVEVLPLLDPREIREAAKPIVGYSDITSLLTFVTGRCDLVAFHGPMLAGRLGRGEQGYDRASFLRTLTVAEPVGSLGRGCLEVVRPGEASGPLLGGTLTQLLASLATPFAFDPPEGHVLFLDEVNERPYRLDRMMVQLRSSGLLARAAAVVFGELPGCDEPEGQPTARDVVAHVMSDFPGPVALGLPSGHTTRPALTLPFGVRARLIGRGTPELVIEEAAVEIGA
jgi:muramoyltetrapeptide carboxypeptidase